MISYDRCWKRELLRSADRIEKRFHQKRWTASSCASLEREVLIGAFSVRKLIESKKCPPAILNRKSDLTLYPISKTVILNANSHFTHQFQLYGGVKESLDVVKMMNQFIHSYHLSAFVPLGGSMFGIFFASDIGKKKGLYYITVAELAGTFRAVGES